MSIDYKLLEQQLETLEILEKRMVDGQHITLVDIPVEHVRGLQGLLDYLIEFTPVEEYESDSGMYCDNADQSGEDS